MYSGKEDTAQSGHDAGRLCVASQARLASGNTYAGTEAPVASSGICFGFCICGIYSSRHNAHLLCFKTPRGVLWFGFGDGVRVILWFPALHLENVL